MRLGVNAWRLSGPRFGVARYAQYLISYWSKQLEDHDSLALYLHGPLTEKIPPASTPIEEVVLGPRLTSALWENLILNRHLGDVDVLFSPGYTTPLLYKGKSVVAIHSVNEIEAGRHSAAYKLSYSLKYRLSAHAANRVIANSQSTKDRIVEYYKVPEEKVDVVWLGADDSFRPANNPERDREIRLEYLGEDKPFVLFVGSMSERRNIPMLMKAFSLLKEREQLPHYLLMIGQNHEQIPLAQLAEKFGIADSFVHEVGSFSHHSEIVPIYNAAEVFVLPSFTEGFSLTLAEAMACGAPVITSSQSSLGEVANGYGITLDELNEESLAEAITKVLVNPELRSQLAQLSLERGKELRWEETARKTLDILKRVANE